MPRAMTAILNLETWYNRRCQEEEGAILEE
jgi:hypothetical protein